MNQPKLHSVTSDDIKEVVARNLSPRVGLHKKWSVECFAELTGQEVQTVYGQISGTGLAPAAKLMRMGDIVGPTFLNEVLALIGMGGAHRIDGEGSDCPSRIISEAADLIKSISEAHADGTRDHRETAIILKEAKELYAWLGGYIHALSQDIS